MSKQLQTVPEVLACLRVCVQALDEMNEALAAVFVCQSIEALERSLEPADADDAS